MLTDGTVDQSAKGKLYASKVIENCVFGAKYDEQALPDKDGYTCDDPYYTIEIKTGHNGYTFKYVLRVVYSVYYYYDGVFDAGRPITAPAAWVRQSPLTLARPALTGLTAWKACRWC